MASAHINTSFIHPQLTRNTQNIRLLSPHSNTKELNFGLETFNINKCPKYAALSYCWGAQSPPSTIIVNNQSFLVSPNLADALRHVWSYLHSDSKENKYLLWVDQICINQNDEEERGDQVQLMRELYSESSFTVAWLGTTDDESSIALELLTRKKGVYSDPRRGMRLHAHKQQRKEYYEKRSLLRKLDDRPYWKRMWIMQEFILPPKLLILCGSTGVWWDDVQRSSGMSYEFCIHMAPLFKRRYMMHSETVNFQFIKLLNIAKYRACTRPFDRVFALLGLAMPGDLQGLRVDYNVPAQTLYRDVVRLLERIVKSEKRWMQLTQDLAEALELLPSERVLTPPTWQWPLNGTGDIERVTDNQRNLCGGPEQ
ncbi:heterokaryon incompatibility protein-domain-containing protein [Nemania abortiva]|nr:heterokaryon incompatibility protein-domain-containing protein [Nemania abortiva]